MPTITTRDGIEIFYKDFGEGQPIVFSHGWPLSADDWDNQIYYFASTGIDVLLTTAGVMGGRHRRGKAMTWTPTPTIWQI